MQMQVEVDDVKSPVVENKAKLTRLVLRKRSLDGKEKKKLPGRKVGDGGKG